MEDLKSNPQQLQRRRLGRQVAVNLDYMLSSVCFPSINDAKFRFISTSDGESVILKIEKVKAPQQWQVVVKELSKHGPNGLPKEAVMMGLKNALQALGNTEKEYNPSSQDPFADAELIEEGALLLCLYIPIVGYPVEYCFKMNLVSRERVDILQTSLHEAIEEIDQLKKQVSELEEEIVGLRADLEESNEKRSSLITVLRTTQSVGTGGVISWNKIELDSLAVTLSSNNQVVTIPMAGLYQVHIRVTGADSGANRHINLQVNEVVVAQSICGFNTGYNCSINLTEFCTLKKGDNLRVFYQSNHNMDAQLVYTNFTLLYIGPI